MNLELEDFDLIFEAGEELVLPHAVLLFNVKSITLDVKE